MKKLLLAFTALSFVAGCNTVNGIGKDIGILGNAIEEVAEENNKNTCLYSSAGRALNCDQ